jgi:hypothetical protein
MKVNINTQVRVTLTMIGASIWNEHEGQFPKELRQRATPGQTVKCELWRLMEVFGPAMQNGMNAPFSDNAITFDTPN